jgi:hypothetical protein
MGGKREGCVELTFAVALMLFLRLNSCVTDVAGVALRCEGRCLASLFDESLVALFLIESHLTCKVLKVG